MFVEVDRYSVTIQVRKNELKRIKTSFLFTFLFLYCHDDHYQFLLFLISLVSHFKSDAQHAILQMQKKNNDCWRIGRNCTSIRMFHTRVRVFIICIIAEGAQVHSTDIRTVGMSHTLPKYGYCTRTDVTDTSSHRPRRNATYCQHPHLIFDL